MIPKSQRRQIIQENIRKLMEYQEQIDNYLLEAERWHQHRLLWPRMIAGRWAWPGQTVYRRYCFSPEGNHWQYGTVFDYLKDAQ